METNKADLKIWVLMFLLAFGLLALPWKAEAGTWSKPGGPDGALVRQLAISPNYAADQTIFAISDAARDRSGSLFKSTDGGTSWFVNIGTPIDTVAFSPNYAVDQTIFASGGATGILKSTDGGTTWNTMKPSAEFCCVGMALTLSPNYSVDQTVFAATNFEILKSTDGGMSWLKITPAGVCAGCGIGQISIATSLNYAIDQTVFATIPAPSYMTGLYKSADGGNSWNIVNTASYAVGVGGVFLSPSFVTDQTLFAISSSGIIKSIDGGTSWSVVSTGLPNGRVKSLAFSPNYGSDQTIFVGMNGLHSSFETSVGLGVFKSTNGGATWTAVNTGLTNLEVNAIVISPSYPVDQTLFAGTYDSEGLFKSTNGGASWSVANTGLAGLLINSVALSPNYPVDQTVFAYSVPFVPSYYGSPSSPGSLYKSIDGGMTWAAVATGMTRGTLVSQIDLGMVSISPNYTIDQSVMATMYGVSRDSGASWTSLPMGDCGIARVYGFSPNYAQDLTIFNVAASCGNYWSYGGEVFRSTDGGNSWGGIARLGGLSLAFSPNYAVDQTVFVGTSGIFKTNDGGSTWTAVSFSGYPTVNALVISPGYSNDFTVFAGTNSGVYKSADGGLSWSLLNVGLSYIPAITSLAISPNFVNDQTILASGQLIGALKSTDGGANWSAVNGGFAGAVIIKSLAISPGYPCDGTVFAGTDGSSVWKYSDTEAMASCSASAPSILFLTPNGGPPGTSVTLTGSNFSATQGGSNVTFNGAPAAVTSWSDTQIIVTVPAGATTGPVVVTVSGVVSNNDHIFTVLVPDFTLSVVPESNTVVQGSCATYTVSVDPVNGFSSSIDFSVPSGLPFGATAIFNPSSVVPQGSSTLEICTSSSTPSGSSVLAIYGAGGDQTHISVVTLTILPGISTTLPQPVVTGKELARDLLQFQTDIQALMGLTSATRISFCLGLGEPSLIALCSIPQIGAFLAGKVFWYWIEEIANDPPDENFRVVVELKPVQPTEAIDNSELANVEARYLTILHQSNSILEAILITNERLQGAVAADEPFFINLQAMALLDLLQLLRVNQLELRDELISLAPLLVAFTDGPTFDGVEQRLFRLAVEGLGVEDLGLLESAGLTAEEIKTIQEMFKGLDLSVDFRIRVHNGLQQWIDLINEMILPGLERGINESQELIVSSDITSPTITASTSSLPNAAGWHNTDVTVSFTCLDDSSGIASCPGPIAVSTEGADQVISGTAVDLAGNSATTSVTINLDKTRPTVTFGSVTPLPGPSGWNNADVTIPFTAADNLSGVAETSVVGPLSFTADGAGLTQTVTVTDMAGNSATFTSPAVNRDTVPPTLLWGTASAAPNAAGWNNTDVSVPFTAADDRSGVADTSVPSPLVLSTEGMSVSGDVTVTDLAGNTASFTSPSYKIDKTPPTLTLPALAESYLLHSAVTFSFGAADSLSDVASLSATLNGVSVSNGSTIVLNQVGLNTFSLTGTDRAGNSTTQTKTFAVNYQFGGFLSPLTASDRTTFRLGSVIPTKFQLFDVNGQSILSAVAHLGLQQFSGTEPTGTPIDATSVSAADSGNLFRTDGTQYIYNLSTKPLAAGTWQLQVTLDDGTTHSAQIDLTSK